MRKKLLTMILVATMTLGLMPSAAFAAEDVSGQPAASEITVETTEEVTEEITEEPEAEPVEEAAEEITENIAKEAPKAEETVSEPAEAVVEEAVVEESVEAAEEAAAADAVEEPIGHIVMSFEMFDVSTQTVVLLRNPEKVGFTAEDTGLTLAQKLLGKENCNISGDWMKGFTIDEVEYTPESVGWAQNGSWLVYKNNTTDSVGITTYKPADGDVYRVVLSTYDTATYAMPTMPNDMDALYWSAVENGGDLTAAYALIQSAGPAQRDIDAMTASLAVAGSTHHILVDGRTIYVDPSYTAYPTLSADKSAAVAGETVTVTTTIPEGLVMTAGSLKANGVELTAAGENTYTFVMPDAPVAITAEFAQDSSNKQNQLTSAEFFFDEAGTQPIEITPEFDPETEEYALSTFDYEDPDSIYFKGSFDESATANWFCHMDFDGYGYDEERPPFASDEMIELSLFMSPIGLTNGQKHRIDVKGASGIVRQYYFTMTMYPTLESLAIDGTDVEAFDPAEETITASVPNGTETVLLNAIPYNEDNYVYVNDSTDDSASSDTEITLDDDGSTDVEITVEDELGVTYTYMLTITEAAAPIHVNMTVSNAGTLALARQDIEVADIDGNGSISYDEALQAVHAQYCEGGYATTETQWGTSVTKLWNVANGGSYLFYQNDVAIPSNVADSTIADGDDLVAAVMADTTNYSDKYSYFDTKEAEGYVGTPIEMTLSAISMDENWKPVVGPAAGVTVGTWDDGTFTAMEGAVTDENGKVALTFEKAGTYVVSAQGSSSNVIVAPVCEIQVAAAPINVFMTISNAGTLALARQEIEVTDLDGNGSISYDEALQAVHAQYCEGGYATAETQYGIGVQKLWGVENGGSYLFYQNDVAIEKDVVNTVVAEDDELVAAVMADLTNWSDAYAYFDKKELDGTIVSTFELTLYETKLDENWHFVTAPAAGVTIGTWADGTFTPLEGKTTDAEGKVSLNFTEAGTYVVSAQGSADNVIVAPECVINVADLKIPYDGDDITFVKSDLETVFGMFKPQDGITCTIEGDEIKIHYVPKNTTIYNAFHWGAIEDELTPDVTFNNDGTMDITVSKDYCGFAHAIAPIKAKDGKTTSDQYYLAIPTEDKLQPADYTAVETAKADAEALDKALYTEDSYAAVTAAVAAVKEGLLIPKQAEVDAMAKAIEHAIDNLVLIYSGNEVGFYKANLIDAFGMLSPVEGSTFVIDGDNVVIHIVPSMSKKTYGWIHLGAITDEELTKDITINEIPGDTTSLEFDLVLPKAEYCGTAHPIAPIKVKDGGTSSAQYYLAIPTEDKLPTKDEITIEEVKVSVGATAAIQAEVVSGKYTADDLEWSTADETIATVAKGEVSGIKVGTTTVTAKLPSGVEASCTVSVLFKDATDPENSFFKAIYDAVEKGITTGFTDGTFRQDDSCTRGQAVTFIWRGFGRKSAKEGTVNTFTDIPTSGDFYDAIMWAKSEGITTGYNETTFGTNDYCTRGQIVTFLWRAAGKPEPASTETSLTDVDPKSPFYKAILWAAESGITTGFADNTFRQDQECTRGQIVTFIYRYNNKK